MKAYKIKEEHYHLKADRIVYRGEHYSILLATPTEPQRFIDHYIIPLMDKLGRLEEIELKDEKWIHPHLYKPLKLQICQNLIEKEKMK